MSRMQRATIRGGMLLVAMFLFPQQAIAHPLHFHQTLPISNQPLTPSLVIFGLITAFCFGAGHALSPGHGKTLVAAYLVGTRGTAKHALWLGLITTIAHTLGVFCLGLVAFFATQYWLPEQIYPVITLLSGLTICGVGFWLLDKQLFPEASLARHHAHLHLEEDISFRSLATLGIAGGMVPCPSALVLLLSAIAIHQTAYGICLLLAFSLGLALVLTAVGLAVVQGQRWLSFFAQNQLTAKLPVASAIGVVAIGLLLVADAAA